MDFKDFLKKEEAVVEYESAAFPERYFKSAGSDYFEQPQRVIKTTALGEWAFEEWKRIVMEIDFPLDFSHWIKGAERFVSHGEPLLLFKIAIGCLGQETMKKRLAELSNNANP